MFCSRPAPTSRFYYERLRVLTRRGRRIRRTSTAERRRGAAFRSQLLAKHSSLHAGLCQGSMIIFLVLTAQKDVRVTAPFFCDEGEGWGERVKAACDKRTCCLHAHSDAASSNNSSSNNSARCVARQVSIESSMQTLKASQVMKLSLV